jgi:hypothetical protein
MKDFAVRGHKSATSLAFHKAPNSAVGRMMGMVYRWVCTKGGLGMPRVVRIDWHIGGLFSKGYAQGAGDGSCSVGGMVYRCAQGRGGRGWFSRLCSMQVGVPRNVLIQQHVAGTERADIDMGCLSKQSCRVTGCTLFQVWSTCDTREITLAGHTTHLLSI